MTVIARTIRSIPERSAEETWAQIIALIAPDTQSAARSELAAVAGTACNCIADEALAGDPLVVFGSGPRVRIYAAYGDDAIEGDSASEMPLAFVPTNGDWRVSIPCFQDDLSWVQRQLKSITHRVTARAVGTDVGSGSAETASSQTDNNSKNAGLNVDRSAFLQP